MFFEKKEKTYTVYAGSIEGHRFYSVDMFLAQEAWQ